MEGPTTLSQPPEATPHTQRKTVQFDLSTDGCRETGGKRAEVSPGAKDVAAAGSQCFENQLFSPGVLWQDSWTIEAQHSGRMDAPKSSSPYSVAALSSVERTPASSAAEYTPANAAYLESARKVDDLRGRLESLEQALRDMEAKAVQHLDKNLQEKVLATAAKIVQKRFLSDKELDKKLQVQILQTAMKVVKRQSNAALEAAAQEAGEDTTPTRRLEFEQQGDSAGATIAAGVQQYIAHIEQGLGEVVRRLERKVDGVSALLDQNALELLEARLASGVVKLEQRLDALEGAQHLQQQIRTSGTLVAPSQLLERVAAVEAAMAEQGHAVADLLAALHTQGSALGSQQAVAATSMVPAAKAPEEVGTATAAVPAAVSPAATALTEQPSAVLHEPVHPPPPLQQLHQRRSAAAKRSALGDPGRSTAASSGPKLPRVKPMHAAGTAQRVAMATAREQLARQAARAQEQQEETPVWVSMVHAFGWIVLLVLGFVAVVMGAVAVMVKNGRLNESDLGFLVE